MEEMMSMREREMEQVFTASFVSAAEALGVFCVALKRGISAAAAKSGVESVARMSVTAQAMFSMGTARTCMAVS